MGAVANTITFTFDVGVGIEPIALGIGEPEDFGDIEIIGAGDSGGRDDAIGILQLEESAWQHHLLLQVSPQAELQVQQPPHPQPRQ